MDVDWPSIRKEFPALSKWTYLNTATYGQTPARAYRAAQEHFLRRDELACSDFLSWFDDADIVRADLGRLIGCEAGDIAFLPTASAALSLLIQGIDWAPGDRVVTLEREFPNNIYWPALLAGRGVEFVEAPWERLYECVTARTRLVAVSSVNYTTGFRPPLAELSRFLGERGVLLYVDGTQSVGALEMDVAAIQPAMMAVDAYKWMLTPNGAGFAYVRPDVREWLAPTVIGWRSHWDWRAVDNLHHGAPQFSPKAERYEGGMLPFPLLCSLGEVTKMMLEIGPQRIERRVLALAGFLRERLRSVGGEPLYLDSPIVSARFEGKDPSAAARKLQQKRVLVSARNGNLRMSLHFYNDEGDVNRLVDALGEIWAS
jgi:selenocysteine lyase/cysteine desulfurase